MLHISFSNRLEPLLELLLANLGQTSGNPLASHHVIIPNAAIKRKVQLIAADRFGVCADIEFSFLAQWMWKQIGEVVEVGQDSPFAACALAWRILRAFEDEKFVQEHSRLARYMERADAVMRYDLACNVASLLEQYMTYRPEWLEAWTEGKPALLRGGDAVQQDQQWQAALWRRIVAELGTDVRHPSTAFFQALESSDASALSAVLPQALNVFCLPSIPPLYLSMLRQLGKRIDLNLYVVNPCREYWLEIVDPRYLGYLAVQGKADYHEIGNRLLAAWGKQTRSHIDLVVDGSGGDVVIDAFVPSSGTTLLATLQDAILDMEELAPASLVLDPEDRSIEVHQCHGLARELEVLQDQLLSLFASPNPPLASDILVVTPRLDDAAPLIDAIFGSTPFERRIPYVITGRPRSKTNPVAQALLDLLAMATSRFQANKVFALLQQPLIGEKFGLTERKLDLVLSWMSEAEIRWAIDAMHRSEFGVPTGDRYTFADGLHRLFLGYALPTGTSSSLNERVAACGIEGSDASALGALWYFIAALQNLRKDLSVPKLPDEWTAALLGVMDNFIDAQDAHIDALREVQEAVRELRKDMVQGGVEEPVALPLVSTALTTILDSPAPGGVPHGAVTFASLTSMRNLPYEVICVIGLNDRDFPGSARPPEYDLMSFDVRRGDRQRSADERNLFLDLILAAKRKLYLSYTGRSAVDNSPLPPSVLVDDLLDYLVPAIASDADSEAALSAARQRLIVEHPLQAFSTACFGGDTRLGSFNAEYCEALKQKMSTAGKRMLTAATQAEMDDEAEVAASALPFFSAALAPYEPDDRTLSLDELISFFRNPCRHLLRNRLQLALSSDSIELLDDEPFAPGRAASMRLAARVLPLLRQGKPLEEVHRLATAGTEYPGGHVGGKLLAEEIRLIDEFARMVQEEERTDYIPPCHAVLELDVDGKPWRLTGAFSELQPHGLIRHRYGNVGATDYLEGWIAHLFLNAARMDQCEPSTSWISRNGRYQLMPCDEPQAHLHTLLTLYLQGQQNPLRFFPRSAWAYIRQDRKLSEAKKVWSSTQFSRGEDQDPAYRLALRGCPDPLDAQFEACAVAVFAPLLEHLKDDRL